MMRAAANTHAVDLNTGRVLCNMRYVDVVHDGSRYLTCCRCCKLLRQRGVDPCDAATGRRWPKVRLVTGLRMVRDSAQKKLEAK